MKKTILLVLIGFFSINAVFAQDSVKFENALLWEISGNQLKEPSYIFGTIHMIPEADFFFPDLWKEKFLKCKTLALEIDINMSLLDQIALAKKIMLPEGKSLSDYMDDEDYLDLQSYMLDSLHIKKSKWNQMNKIKPLFSMSLIYDDLLSNMKTYEVELNNLAKKNNMPVKGLETADYQIDVLNTISIEEQIEMLTGDELTGDPLEELEKIVKDYRNQDINQMLQTYKQDPSMLKFENELLIQRNKNWIPLIQNLASEGSTFIAVGAMHLPGNNGVLQLLKNAGYAVRSVK
jgi:uncharacterized protein YbaP (TraB family)